MKREPKIALGIEISDGRINLALLKKKKSGIELLKTASGSVPDGAIKNGNIEDASALARTIKELKSKNKIREPHAAMSLIANPQIMQILDLPNQAFANIGQFLHDEVRHYAVFSMKSISLDFCGIKSSAKTEARRAFIVAVDSQKLIESVKVLNRADLNIDTIEPAPLSYIRACYAKKIAKKYDQNLLFAIVHEGILTLCVFKNQTLGFVETKQLEVDTFDPDKCFDWIIEKIDEILKFYEHKVSDRDDKWDVNIIADIRSESVKQKLGALAIRFRYAELTVRTLEDAYLDTPLAEVENSDKPSAIAVGLAMKLLNFSNGGLNINLLPPETTEIKTTRKHTLMIANAAAFFFLLVTLSISFFGMEIKKIHKNIQQKGKSQLGCSIRTLLDEQASLNEQITNVSENLSSINDILSTKSFLRWDQILSEIRSTIPKPVRITNISSEDNSKVLFRGQALYYESIHLFVEMLNNSTHIKSASLIGTEKDDELSGLVTYSVNCSLIE